MRSIFLVVALALSSCSPVRVDDATRLDFVAVDNIAVVVVSDAAVSVVVTLDDPDNSNRRYFDTIVSGPGTIIVPSGSSLYAGGKWLRNLTTSKIWFIGHGPDYYDTSLSPPPLITGSKCRVSIQTGGEVNIYASYRQDGYTYLARARIDGDTDIIIPVGSVLYASSSRVTSAKLSAVSDTTWNL